MRSSTPSGMNSSQSAHQWQPQQQPQYNPYQQQNISYIQRQHPYTAGNSTPTPPHSTSSATSSPGMAYTALHHHPAPYPQALPSVQHQGQPMNHPYSHSMAHSPYPLRRQLPPQIGGSPQQQQIQLQQQQQQQAQQAQQSQQSQQSQQQPQQQSPSAPVSVIQPNRSSPGSTFTHAHPDVYFAPNAAILYNHANALAAAQAQAQNGASDYAGGSTPPRLPPILQVEKQQVTTSATQAASASRRRNEAHFVCPVPGCGSTFTRRFNLRGHLRSHTEERPYVCEWPGCNKGFARQHDCKRHQALHSSRSTSNVCHGCGKTFSRLDALNRHLRSEGGAECRRTHEQTVAAAKQNAPSKSNPINAFRTNGNGGAAPMPLQYTNGLNARHDGSGSSAYDSDGTNSAGVRSAQMTPAPAPAPSLAAQ